MVRLFKLIYRTVWLIFFVNRRKAILLFTTKVDDVIKLELPKRRICIREDSVIFIEMVTISFILHNKKVYLQQKLKRKCNADPLLCLQFYKGFNPLRANPRKSSNRIKQLFGFCRRIFLVCLTIL